jgi:hypothetical protein
MSASAHARVLHLESHDLFPLFFGFVSVVFVVHDEFRASVRQRGDVEKEVVEVVVVYASKNKWVSSTLCNSKRITRQSLKVVLLTSMSHLHQPPLQLLPSMLHEYWIMKMNA